MAQVMTLQFLKDMFAHVPWDEPIAMLSEPDASPRYACRVCVANEGLHGSAIPALPADPEVVREHIREAHR